MGTDTDTGTDTPHPGLAFALLALLAAILFGLQALGYAGDEAFAAATLAIVLPGGWRLRQADPAGRRAATGRTPVSWPIAVLLTGAAMLCLGVMDRIGPPHLLLNLFLAVGSAVEAVAHVQRLASARRRRATDGPFQGLVQGVPRLGGTIVASL